MIPALDEAMMDSWVGYGTDDGSLGDGVDGHSTGIDEKLARKINFLSCLP